MTDPLTPVEPGTWLHNKQTCRACGYTVDATSRTDSGGRAPTDGDFTVCLRCGEVSVFTIGPLGVALREPTGEELAEFASGPGPKMVRELHRFNAARQQP